MKILQFFKFLLFFYALSFIYFALVPSATLFLLIKLLALSTAVSILLFMFYPNVRGIKKGDRVIILGGFPYFPKFGVAITDGKISEEIRIKTDDGKEALGIIESYEGLFTPPKVRLLYEEKLIE